MHYNVLQKNIAAFCRDEVKVLSKSFGVHASQFFQWLAELILTATHGRDQTKQQNCMVTHTKNAQHHHSPRMTSRLMH